MDPYILTASNIDIIHGFTTRDGEPGLTPLQSMNLSMSRAADPNHVVNTFFSLGGKMGFDPYKLVLANQTHSTTIGVCTAEDHMGFDSRNYPECDALITRDPGTALCVFTADCAPILLWDTVLGAVGAVHAGWRGTVSKLVCRTIRAMEKHYGSYPRDIHAAIGPSIGPCCFETDEDVPNALLRAFGPAAAPYIRRDSSGKYHPDLKGLNVLALSQIGVPSIEVLPDCTKCKPQLYFSHRAYTQGEGPRQEGRQGAIIVCYSTEYQLCEETYKKRHRRVIYR